MPIFSIAILAILVWMVTAGPLRHVGRAVLIYRAQFHPEITEETDVAEWQPVRVNTWATRGLIGILLGAGILGLSLHPTTIRLRDLPPSESARLITHYNSNNPASPGMTTAVIAGFPFRGIEGDGGGSFQGYLPADRGLHVLWGNSAILTLLGLLLASLLPTRWLGTALSVSIALAIYGGYRCVLWCTYYWD